MSADRTLDICAAAGGRVFLIEPQQGGRQ